MPDIGVTTLQARQQRQLETRDRFNVFHDFQFSDRVEDSGIEFVHESVDDALKNWTTVHYDHGNGVAVADVDSDGLYDIYFTTQLGSNELWKNLGEGKFKNITGEAGVALGDRISVAASFADIDNDGDPDLYVTTVRMGNVLLENLGGGRFSDISSESGLDHVGHSSGAVFFDYDRDGLLDLYLTNVGRYTTDEQGRGGFYRSIDNAFSGHLYPDRAEASILFRNQGKNRFKDVSARLRLEDTGWSGDVTIVDFNQDKYPDLYVLNMQGDDHYYENVGGDHFVEKTQQHFAKTSWGAMGIKSFDYDNDGLMDLLTTDMHSDMDHDIDPYSEKLKVFPTKPDVEYYQGGGNNVFGNSFYRNLGRGQFEEISQAVGAENYWPWGVSVGDLNADGFEDVFIASSMNYPFRYGINSVLLNNNGEGFLDSEFILGIEPRRNGRTDKPLFDLDCSGEDDSHHLCEGREGRVTVVGALGTRSSVIFDLDGDGDLDIVTNEFNDRPQVLLSNLTQQTEFHHLAIKLVGTESNRDGLGALVKVSAGELVLTKYHDGSSGYLSHSSLPLYFGLDGEEKLDRVDVIWPSGLTQTITRDLSVDRLIEITEN